VGERLKDIVIRVAAQPSAESHAALRSALPAAIVFVELTGVPKPASGTGPPDRLGPDARVPLARLPNGMRMVKVSASSPRRVAANVVVGTMTGREALRMVMKTDADGIVIAAEDEKNSWTAIKRRGIQEILARLEAN
jgi:hypothetical protein